MDATVHVSDQFRLELLKRRASGVRVYEIARAAGVRSNTLSGIAAGSTPVRMNDPRVLRVAAVLGLAPAVCFSEFRANEITPQIARRPKSRRLAHQAVGRRR